MGNNAHFADWSQLAESDRIAARKQCRNRLQGIGRKLHAVVDELSPRPAVQGALSGFPYVAKDMIATGVAAAGWGCVTPLVEAGPAASIVDRLSAAGACLIATAEMTELAYEPSGINAGRGNVLNPWNVAFAPGGSSSGSAALVASGCCFAALGSDTGGSVRIPAHCCGITGLKPTWGGIAVDGTMPLAPSLDTIGILARSASDIAVVWDALSPGGAIPDLHGSSAAVLDDAFAESEPEIARLCRDGVDLLAQQGMSLFARAGFPEDADRNVLVVMQAEAARTHSARLNDDKIDAVLRKRLRKGLAITDSELTASLDSREKWRDAFISHYLGGASVALLPVMPIRTPRIDEVDPASPAFKAKTLYALSRLTRFVNYLGLPALVLPVGFDDRGMPVGLQIVGRLNSEALLLQIAIKFQSMTDWHGRIPSGIAADVAAEKGMTA
ncbi:MAG: amidase [Pseudolabrys sp.]|nr:amidase [Pseudolabrys sp.]MDP2298945.1 amidase [Pseudolabrys sp.]